MKSRATGHTTTERQGWNLSRFSLRSLAPVGTCGDHTSPEPHSPSGPPPSQVSGRRVAPGAGGAVPGMTWSPRKGEVNKRRGPPGKRSQWHHHLQNSGCWSVGFCRCGEEGVSGWGEAALCCSELGISLSAQVWLYLTLCGRGRDRTGLPGLFLCALLSSAASVFSAPLPHHVGWQPRPPVMPGDRDAVPSDRGLLTGCPCAGRKHVGRDSPSGAYPSERRVSPPDSASGSHLPPRRHTPCSASCGHLTRCLSTVTHDVAPLHLQKINFCGYSYALFQNPKGIK